MGCINSTSAANIEDMDSNNNTKNKRKLAKRLTINGPLGLDLEGSKYAVNTDNNNNNKKKKSKSSKKNKKDKDNNVIGNKPNYGNIDKDGIQPSGGTVTISKLPFKYGTMSKTGKKPSKRRKQNQDCFTVIDTYLNMENQMFLGVFDGHGPNGGLVSRYCREHLPKKLQRFISNDGSIELCEKKKKLNEAIRNACFETNKQLTNSTIDVYVSGTTCISAIICNKKVYTINIGDSRAVMGKVINGKLKSVDLSDDQKPDRPDEEKRILKKGGRVFEWGVPRVWLKDVDMPGLAMSRSFGDGAAATVGVHSVPEIKETFLGIGCKFLIFASDGVWEFISSQEAVDIVGKYYNQKEPDPQLAAVKLVEEGIKRWKKEDDSIDDTTAIVVFLNYKK